MFVPRDPLLQEASNQVLSCPEEKSIDALKGSEPLGLLYGAGGISLEGPWSAI